MRLTKTCPKKIYRVPGTIAQISLQRCQKILHIRSTVSGNAMIGTDQTFNYMNIEHQGITGDLLDAFVSSRFVPTINQTNTNYT